MHTLEQKVRQTGRTALLVESLPVDGCFVVTSNLQMGLALSSVIVKMRPDIPINTITFITGTTRESVLEKVRGSRLPVYVDHDVWTRWNVLDLGLFNISHKMGSFLPK
jgi:hypothetical protein